MSSLAESLAGLYWPPFIFAVLVGVPSAALYLCEVLIIVRKWKRFNTTFYVLFISRAILNLSNFATSYLGQRFLKMSLFLPFYRALPQPAICFFYFSLYYFFHAENLANFYLLLNRLTCIALQKHYEVIWKWLLVPALLSVLTVPLSVSLKSFFVNMTLVKDEFGNGYTTEYTYYPGYKETLPGFWRIGDNFFAELSALIFLVVCLLINLVTLVYLKRTKMVVANAKDQRKQQAERRMAVYAIISFSGQLLMALYFIYRYWQSLGKKVWDPHTYQLLNEIGLNNYGWANDLATVVLPSWLMLWASERLRRDLLDHMLGVLTCLAKCCTRFVPNEQKRLPMNQKQQNQMHVHRISIPNRIQNHNL